MLNFSTKKYICVVVVLEAVLIFQAEKDITEEILAERRTKCSVRRHGTTGRRSLRSYRMSKGAESPEGLTTIASTARGFGERRRATVRPDQGVRGRTVRSYRAREERPKSRNLQKV